MTIKMTIMAKQSHCYRGDAKLLALLDEVEAGEAIVITLHGRTMAGITPVRGPHSLKDLFKGVAVTNATDEELFSKDEVWEVMRDDDTP